MDRQCRAHRKNGDQCKKSAIVGGTVCQTHGGGAPQVKLAAEARIQALVDPAITRLGYLIDNADFDSVRLAAVKDALDRAGYKAVEKAEVLHSVKLADREQVEAL